MSAVQQYETGEEIHVGDRVAYNCQTGQIVFVADRGDFMKDYENSDDKTGFMIEFDNGARLFLEASDRRLSLIMPAPLNS